ncbi:alkaline phosphatase family protein [Metarhizium album ARSEF 1941]|uniref:Alkaline phosphatase family protein n=1 Tax=Metarhizium album (strain ARSEF 1941) TaxID=1081103 RepID=A0A0B2X4W1_METAS|nr:alkaline phosphatase family protein [Metarhizium album ARSEF 1941]KHO01409.1 alkaline phosphatase family protein [Metarhizium album ARSEF 1941]
MPVQATIAKVTSVALRISALLFFRFFPAHFPSITFALFVIYVPAYVASYRTVPALEIVDDEVDVTVKQTTVTSETPLLSETDQPPEPEVVAQEVDVDETIVLEEKIERPWKVLLYGHPSATRPKLSILTFLINVVLALLTADALFRARLYYSSEDLSFARLGYLSHSEANFLIREPDQARMPVTLQIRVKATEPSVPGSAWSHAVGIQQTTNETDFTKAITVPLRHSEQLWYEWRTSNNHSGKFLSPPKPGSMPTVNDGKFTFLSTSCILPRFPYNPMDHALAIPGLRHLARKLPDMGAQFMLFLGDFIYVDVPERFGKSIEEYRMQYRQVYASPDWAPVAQNLSWIHVLDDHEISNDWSSNTTGIYNAAVGPWRTYQASVNPPKAVQAGSRDTHRQDATWYEFVQGPASFFMLDTRSHRSSNNAPFEEEDKTMLGQDQLADFLAWLDRPEPKGVKWKFVASSVPFTKNWPVNVKDTWGGFLVERRKILRAMWNAGTRGTSVVILSGDRHEFAATKFPPPSESKWPESAAVYEFSTSPLNQFASPIPTYKQVDSEDVKLQ